MLEDCGVCLSGLVFAVVDVVGFDLVARAEMGEIALDVAGGATASWSCETDVGRHFDCMENDLWLWKCRERGRRWWIWIGPDLVATFSGGLPKICGSDSMINNDSNISIEHG